MTVGVHFQAPSAALGAACTSGSVTTTSGSTVIVVIIASSGGGGLFGATPIQDSKSNTWTQIDSDVVFSSSTDRARVYKATNITGGAGHTFTCNPNGTSFGALLGCEITGAPASPTVTISVGNNDTTSPYTSGNVTLSASGTLVGFIWTDAPSGTETDTWAGSFASGDKVEEIGNANASITGSMAAVDKAAGTYSSSVTVSGVTVTDTANWVVGVQTSSSTGIGGTLGGLIGGIAEGRLVT